jgi:Ni,Fe-hydrogenase I large subunit
MIKLGGLIKEALGKPGQVIPNPYARAFAPIKEADEDHEVKMAQGQLDYIIKTANELKGKLGNAEKNIPGWIQDHISKAHSYLHQSNSGYHEYNGGMNEEAPCWKGYQQIGMKDKGGRQVPNCVPNESVVNEIGGISKVFVAYMALQNKVRELEDTQKALLQPYLDAKKSNNITAMNKAIDALKKNQKTLDSFRKNLSKVETKYIQNLDADAEYEGE